MGDIHRSTQSQVLISFVDKMKCNGQIEFLDNLKKKKSQRPVSIK